MGRCGAVMRYAHYIFFVRLYECAAVHETITGRHVIFQPVASPSVTRYVVLGLLSYLDMEVGGGDGEYVSLDVEAWEDFLESRFKRLSVTIDKTTTPKEKDKDNDREVTASTGEGVGVSAEAEGAREGRSDEKQDGHERQIDGNDAGRVGDARSFSGVPSLEVTPALREDEPSLENVRAASAPGVSTEDPKKTRSVEGGSSTGGDDDSSVGGEASDTSAVDPEAVFAEELHVASKGKSADVPDEGADVDITEVADVRAVPQENAEGHKGGVEEGDDSGRAISSGFGSSDEAVVGDKEEKEVGICAHCARAI